MRILVSGGAGYIGSHAVRALIEKGHDPIVVDNLVYGHRWIIDEVLKVPFFQCSVGEKDIMKAIVNGSHNSLKDTVHQDKFVEGVIHFAAFAYVGESVENPLKYYKNNVIDSLNLLDVLSEPVDKYGIRQKSNIPFVFSSTCATYGLPNQIPIKEDLFQDPINPYGKTKLVIENVLKDLNNANGFEYVILRYFNAAGASPDSIIGEDHEPETHLIPLVIKAAVEDDFCLKVFGNDYGTRDGTCIRDYIHVCDLAEAHILALEKLKDNFFRSNCKNDPNKRIFNLGNGNGISVKEVIKSVEGITGKKVKYVVEGRRKGDPPVLIACYEKAKIYLNWEPKFNDIDIIIKHAYLWYLRLKEKKFMKLDN